MDFQTVVFFFLSAILIFASLRVITARNPVHAALHLILAFFTCGGIWALLQAEFLAIAIILVYVGAVMVLFLFVIMMLDLNLDILKEGFTRYLPVGLAVAGIVAVEMILALQSGTFHVAQSGTSLPANNTEALGALLYTDYVYPFEIAAVILVVAIVAAIMLTLRRRTGVKKQDVGQQVQVRRADRVRLVKMKAEK